MFRSFSIIKDTIHFRMINLLSKNRLNNIQLQSILNIPLHEIRQHLKKLHQIGMISLDPSSSSNTYHISDSFIENNLLFYQLTLIQINKNPIYQNDLIQLEHILKLKN